jgi:hypothetical protein
MRLGFLTGMRGRWLTIAIGVALGAFASCTDIPSDPNTPFAIEFNFAPAPGVVLGEPMFDSLGVVRPLTAIAYNSSGDVITGAAITYHVVPGDSVPVTVNATTGIVTGKSEAAYAGKTARVYAQAGGLQSGTVIITATRSPDTLIAFGKVQDTLVLRFANVDSLPFNAGASVALRHRPAAASPAADSAVPAYLVRFKIVKPAGADTDTSYVMLTGDGRHRSELDTTDAGGVASRQIRVRRVNFPFAKPATDDTIFDSVIVQSSAVKQGGGLVPGSGRQFLLIVKARKQ